MVSEKVGGAEGTKLDDDFRDLERVREHRSELHLHTLRIPAGLFLLYSLFQLICLLVALLSRI